MPKFAIHKWTDNSLIYSGEDSSFAEVVERLVKEGVNLAETFFYNFESTIDLKLFPHACSKCKSPAYIGFNKTECSNIKCQ